jgi:hypothetical protein
MSFSADGMPFQVRSSATLESERGFDEWQETIDFGGNYDLVYWVGQSFAPNEFSNLALILPYFLLLFNWTFRVVTAVSAGVVIQEWWSIGKRLSGSVIRHPFSLRDWGKPQECLVVIASIQIEIPTENFPCTRTQSYLLDQIRPFTSYAMLFQCLEVGLMLQKSCVINSVFLNNVGHVLWSVLLIASFSP